jgi:hypothetical protein
MIGAAAAAEHPYRNRWFLGGAADGTSPRWSTGSASGMAICCRAATTAWTGSCTTPATTTRWVTPRAGCGPGGGGCTVWIPDFIFELWVVELVAAYEDEDIRTSHNNYLRDISDHYADMRAFYEELQGISERSFGNRAQRNRDVSQLVPNGRERRLISGQVLCYSGVPKP